MNILLRSEPNDAHLHCILRLDKRFLPYPKNHHVTAMYNGEGMGVADERFVQLKVGSFLSGLSAHIHRAMEMGKKQGSEG